MAKLLVNSENHYQTPHSVVSDLLIRVCTVCQLPFWRSPDQNRLYLKVLFTTAADIILNFFFFFFFFFFFGGGGGGGVKRHRR